MNIFLKIKAGKISSAAIGALFGATGINVKKLIEELNEKTKKDIGLRVLFNVEIDILTRTYILRNIEQPIAYKLQKLNKSILKKTELEQFVINNYDPIKYTSKEAMYKQIIGTCKSMKINVTN